MQDTPTTNRWTKRSFLGIPLIGWALLVATGTALAAFVFMVTLGTTGTITIGDGIDEDAVYFDAGVSVDGGCAAAIVGENLNITNLGGLLPGDYCEVYMRVANSGDVPVKFQGFQANYPTGFNTGFQANWSYWVGEGEDATEVPVTNCGTEVPAADSGVPGTAEVGIRLSIDQNTAPGSSYTFQAGDGWVFVPSAAYDENQCG
jgi:hypothetical protein